jgi:Flp pilus assembly protein TadG
VEIALAIPTLLLIVGLMIGAIKWSMDAVTATSVAAETARDIVRGEPTSERLEAAKRSVASAEWSARIEPFEVCVDARMPPPLPLMGHVTVTQCASR